ncbi:MAG: DUF177 domain-containing protein [Clostridia bacterium]|nr:DUF177 domain-containing protein [Clostridia bacterium]
MPLNIYVGKLKNIKSGTDTFALEDKINSEAYGYQELSLPAVVVFKGTVEKADGLLIVKGCAYGKAELLCGRCLTTFLWDFAVDVLESFSNVSKVVEAEFEDNINLFCGEEIDITPYILRQIFLELPMKAVCREDCKGLCPYCGTNLNIGKCNCSGDNIDPRFEKLKTLLNSIEKGVE